MLVLTRKAGECISVGSEIEISVLRISGNRVEIGVHAPRDVPIRRQPVSLVLNLDAPQPNSHSFELPDLINRLCAVSPST